MLRSAATTKHPPAWSVCPVLMPITPGTFGNGIALIGKNLETSFHMSNASLGAVAFIAQVSQLLWAVPLALWADRGSRKVVSALALLVFAVLAPLMALAPNVWWFVVLYLLASVGSAREEGSVSR